MLVLNVIGGLMVGNGLGGLVVLASHTGHSLFGTTGSAVELVLGGLILLVRAFQLGRETR